MKCTRLTSNLLLKLTVLKAKEESGIPGVAVKCVDIWKNTVAKAALWLVFGAEMRKRGERTGLDTLVVHALNDGY